MRLTDIMSSMGLAGWAVAAMVLFILVYVAQLFWTFAPHNRDVMARGANMPLDEDLRIPPAAAQDNHSQESRPAGPAKN